MNVTNKSMNRRNFIHSVSIGIGALSFGTLVGRMSVVNSNSVGSRLNIQGEIKNLPKIDNFPVQSNSDLFLLFNIVGQSLFPTIRQNKIYLSAEYEIFKSVMDKGFFVLANDYAIRYQSFYDDMTLLVPHNDDGRYICLADSIRSYYKSWGEVVYIMLTHSHAPLLDFISMEQT